MHLLRSEASLTLLEYARTERNPLRLREYIDVFKGILYSSFTKAKATYDEILV